MTVRIIQGDCVEQMGLMEAESVDAIVTDPPYELGFMGKSWDASGVAFRVETWAAALRVLKPGGHLLAFSGSRTYHRMVVAIEDAGFEIRDQIMWVYGSGFPKSLDVSKAIDKVRDDSADVENVRRWLDANRVDAGISRKEINERMGLASNGGGLASTWTTNGTTRAVPQWEQWLVLKTMLGFGDEMDAEVWRLNGRKGKPGEAWQSAEVVGTVEGAMSGWSMDGGTKFADRELKAPNSDAARQWQGWGTALKPAHEPIVVARKPLVGTVAANVLRHGTGALNICECRVEPTGESRERIGESSQERRYTDNGGTNFAATPGIRGGDPLGRWPANLIHDGSDEVVAAFPDAVGQQGDLNATGRPRPSSGRFGDMAPPLAHAARVEFDKSAARFFYTAKATKADRNEGTQGVMTWEHVDLSPLEEALSQLQRGTSAASTLMQDAPGWSIASCGSEQTAQCLTSIRSIIATASRPTTDSTTLSSSRRSSTSASIQAAIATARGSGSSLAELAEFISRSKAATTSEQTALALDAAHALFVMLSDASKSARKGNVHSTVKPTALMRYLCRLVTPPGGTVLDPFMGSGSTLKAAELEGFSAIGIELDPAYVEIARNRIAADAPLFRDIT